MPPIRSTAIGGVGSDPSAWMQTTGSVPKTIANAVGQRPATIQDKRFATLFLIKALFICESRAVLDRVGLHRTGNLFSGDEGDPRFARLSAMAGGAVCGHHITRLMDIGVGALIASRRTCAIGLVAGIVLSLGYMAGTAILTPDLWIEPLGTLVKTGPAIMLMLDNR